ncbi:transmembrane protein 179-like [Babylonia areolata]|uniref:transmembrane protein 179-like n=1 Tax=Babylonia areolata TaxID=304850 RepID=UPI003FCFB97A
MGLANILLLAQVTLYLISLILSFFMYVPISVNLNDFDGHCLLFATGKWTADKLDVLLQVDWGSSSSCNFAVFSGVAVMLASLFYLIWYSVLLFKNVDSSWLDAFVCGGISLLLTIFTFASGLAISIGFRDWCILVTDPKAGFESCEDGDYIPFGQKLGINTRHFYTEFQIAQFGAWLLWISQLSLLILSAVKLCRYHSQEAFLTSMTRERQRLIQRVQSQSAGYKSSVPT